MTPKERHAARCRKDSGERIQAGGHFTRGGLPVLAVGLPMEVNEPAGVNRRKPSYVGDCGIVRYLAPAHCYYRSHTDGRMRRELRVCCYPVTVLPEEVAVRMRAVRDSWSVAESVRRADLAASHSWRNQDARKARWCESCRNMVMPGKGRQCPACKTKTVMPPKVYRDRAAMPAVIPTIHGHEASLLDLVRSDGFTL